MNCEHCNKKISSKPNLIRHQKTNKSCLKIQRNKNLETKEYSVQCGKYSKKYRYNYELKNHKCLEIVENKNNIIIDNLLDKLKEKDKIIQELS